MSEAYRGHRYFLLETQNFAPEDGPAPVTSYLRVGGVLDREKLKDADTMRGLTPAAGAVTARTGAGEDLASRVTSFTDDDRDRCYPPVLDEHAEAKEEVEAENAVWAQRLALQKAEDRLGGIDDILLHIIEDARGWLGSLYERTLAAEKHVEELEEAYAAAVAAQTEAAANAEANGEPPAFCPGYVSLAERQRETARLFERGGWRDHTDGNRIITTRGDKVEVVRGNYRMIVLGRHAEPRDALGRAVLPGFDVSGGHIQEPNIVVAQDTEIAWKRRQNGTWHTLETTQKSDTDVFMTGDSESYSFGHHRISRVGTETPDAWHEPKDCTSDRCRTNPKIISTINATLMDTQTGSPSWWIPEMAETTWGKEIRSETHAGTLSDMTRVATTTTRTRVRGEMTNETKAGIMATTTEALLITDEITNMMMISLTLGDSFTRTFGTQTSVTAGTMVDVVAGGELNITLIDSADISLGASLELMAGLKADLTMGASMQITLGMDIATNSATQIGVSLYSFKKIVPLLALKGANLSFG